MALQRIWRKNAHHHQHLRSSKDISIKTATLQELFVRHVFQVIINHMNAPCVQYLPIHLPLIFMVNNIGKWVFHTWRHIWDTVPTGRNLPFQKKTRFIHRTSNPKHTQQQRSQDTAAAAKEPKSFPRACPMSGDSRRRPLVVFFLWGRGSLVGSLDLYIYIYMTLPKKVVSWEAKFGNVFINRDLWKNILIYVWEICDNNW